jgi:catechol 2,3-dioxygenase-like lactoylglutathione lyase family enzyme
MLSDLDPMPTLAVSDLQRARDFYEDVLGFQPQGEPAEGVVYKSGAGTILVYPSAYAGTNKATAVSFQVSAATFDNEVAGLRDRGITFDVFEMDPITWDNGVASMPDGSRAAWFSDPDGNILNIETGM